MFEKLEAMKLRLSRINAKLMEPEIFKDGSSYGKLTKEMKELLPIVKIYDSCVKLKREHDEAEQILKGIS